MTRFLVLFGALLLIALLLMAGMLAQNGYSLMDPAMTPMVFAAVLVAGYVSWRINGILKRRDQSRGASLDKTGGKSGGIFSSKPSAAQSARAARVAARRKKLISEGKLEAEPEPETKPETDEAPPERVSQASPIKDRMAARAERVRRAKEQGKL
ncbi:hypothetical protein [Hyphomonas adhaerens]|jgi:hypothetical protein|uniref:hypothetical protein n=1 Tax=Hyphomonas adhaerens TaxID=81029 RepID=UPI002355E3A7|nr:hypothetical protein [Hyphomonas adhaerens]|tara:strand:+ start:127 stop:588 length:462 start_codon:yes stop_codon:yes gene_type:complete